MCTFIVSVSAKFGTLLDASLLTGLANLYLTTPGGYPTKIYAAVALVVFK